MKLDFLNNAEYEAAKLWCATSMPTDDFVLEQMIKLGEQDQKDSNESYRDLVRRTDSLLAFGGVFIVWESQQVAGSLGLRFFAILCAMCGIGLSLLGRIAIGRPQLPDHRSMLDSIEKATKEQIKNYIAQQYYLCHVIWNIRLNKLGSIITFSVATTGIAIAVAVINLLVAAYLASSSVAGP